MGPGALSGYRSGEGGWPAPHLAAQMPAVPRRMTAQVAVERALGAVVYVTGRTTRERRPGYDRRDEFTPHRGAQLSATIPYRGCRYRRHSYGQTLAARDQLAVDARPSCSWALMTSSSSSQMTVSRFVR